VAVVYSLFIKPTIDEKKNEQSQQSFIVAASKPIAAVFVLVVYWDHPRHLRFNDDDDNN
jgi:hypothetical protein